MNLSLPIRVLIAIAMIAIALGIFLFMHGSESRAIARCMNGPQNFAAKCYTDLINNVLASKGLPAALSVLSEVYAADPMFINYCHANTHDLGKAAYKIFHDTGHVDLTTAASYCGFGFYHGFMEEMFVETGSLDGARAFCTYVAESLPDQQYAEGSCYHGIGHGVTDGTDPRLWGDPLRMIGPSLALCRTVTPTDEYDMRCASGVFNSIALMYRDPKYKLDTSHGPYALCTSTTFNTSEKKGCYDQMNTLASFISNHDLEKSLAYTDTIDARYRASAIQSLSSVVMAQREKPTAEAAIHACAALSGEYRTACIQGIAGGLMEFGEPGNEYVAAIVFCANTALSSNEQKACFSEVLTVSQGIYSQQKIQNVCNEIPENFRTEPCVG